MHLISSTFSNRLAFVVCFDLVSPGFNGTLLPTKTTPPNHDGLRPWVLAMEDSRRWRATGHGKSLRFKASMQNAMVQLMETGPKQVKTNVFLFCFLSLGLVVFVYIHKANLNRLPQ